MNTTYTLTDGTLLCWTIFTLHHDDGTEMQARTGLRWEPSDPLAVLIEFIPRGSTPNVWAVSRDLLLDGMSAPSDFGGDIQVWPASPVCVGLYLASPFGCAQFSVSLNVLRDFLAATYHRCARGAEYTGFEMDAELAALLHAEGRW